LNKIQYIHTDQKATQILSRQIKSASTRALSNDFLVRR